MSKESFLPATGTRDIEPISAQIRNDVIYKITSGYKKYGFNSIETPSLEKLENLVGKKGGENEKLIFKILKRGDELKEALKNGSADENDIADFGLRYDLTVPLARYYAHYKDKLPKPFKVFQIGNVWRAERPQKSRYRQFTQCDIDIIGDPTANCEIELIYVTCKTLQELKIKNFEVRINDRQILKKISENCGINNDNQYRDFLIALDKLDKKSLDDVIEELRKKSFAEDVLLKIKNTFESLKTGQNNQHENYLKSSDSLKLIIETVKTLLGDVSIRFDPALVRGMDYYTGTIYEVNEINGSISFGGGGRYNNMIGGFSGQDISACGFSLGFERIIDAFFSGSDAQNAGVVKKAALIYSSDKDNYCDIIKLSESFRSKYDVVSIFERQKNMANQLEKLKAVGFTHWGIFKSDNTVIDKLEK
ncbi:histidine--tRNA ligase [Endomicrobium proavitum]|uniref:Histidine--tRNA ligase n=1 Tax=Endomicrobium proavitum TaxID=1408281 RepID=A0A0G3WK60_9BACT|nr:histidine--tRNA ligase [Endomicrobium proavitum]AKL98267.1 Histidyl-tRNA synthetase [Endomicrobium proavitum]